MLVSDKWLSKGADHLPMCYNALQIVSNGSSDINERDHRVNVDSPN